MPFTGPGAGPAQMWNLPVWKQLLVRDSLGTGQADTQRRCPETRGLESAAADLLSAWYRTRRGLLAGLWPLNQGDPQAKKGTLASYCRKPRAETQAGRRSGASKPQTTNVSWTLALFIPLSMPFPPPTPTPAPICRRSVHFPSLAPVQRGPRGRGGR